MPGGARRLFAFVAAAARPTKFKSARQGGAQRRSQRRPAENIRSRTNDREVINNVTEPGSRVTCRG